MDAKQNNPVPSLQKLLLPHKQVSELGVLALLTGQGSNVKKSKFSLTQAPLPNVLTP
tara:strand:+ start:276 stop:446 length:171 start_codon:yes stop_codon:yes gene_type:complete